VEPAALPERQGVVAFLSSQQRRGPWRLSPATRVVSVFGSAELDLREVDLAAGESVVEVFCLLGSVEIIVPPGVRVLHDGSALVGSFEVEADDRGADGRDHAVLRITGNAYLGSVEVRQQAFGESAREARKRRRKRQ
jgi:hypothetical protein